MIDRVSDMRTIINRAFFQHGFGNQGTEIATDVQRPPAIREDVDPELLQELSEEFARTALPQAVRYLLARREDFRAAFTDEYLEHLDL